MTDNDKLKEFIWDHFQIRNIDGSWVLFLLTTKERSDFIYEIISKVSLRLGVDIDSSTKLYTITLTFRYNEGKDIDFSYNTGTTSDEYPPLLMLNSGAVKFITVGVGHSENTSLVFFHKPLLNLDCIVHPN